MKRIFLADDPNRYGDDEADKIHYDGCGLIGSHTLCGATDWIGAIWEGTTKRVNCKGCLAVRNHVLGK